MRNRILFLTPGPIDFPIGSGEVLRKIVQALPPASVCWASLSRGVFDQADNVLACKSFPPADKVGWRLRNSFFGFWCIRELEARVRARRIAEWASQYAPGVLWILAEGEAVGTGYHLGRLTQLRTHLTFHDAPEIITARFGNFTRPVRKLYMRRLRRLISLSSGLDAVSAELAHHARKMADNNWHGSTMVFPPSLPGPARKRVRGYSGKCRRIGFCGTLRASADQWKNFVGRLTALPFNFEITAFADAEYFPKVDAPSGIRLLLKECVKDRRFEAVFSEEEFDACYLPLYRDSDWDLFVRTSLSSKLATYALSGTPIIVDGPSDSVAWRLVLKYRAGVLSDDMEGLSRLFADSQTREVLADGSRAMFEKEFDLDRNVQRFRRVLDGHESV